MKTKNASRPQKRSYTQTARARAAEETATRIVEVFFGFLHTDWYDDISLEQVAREAGVTVPTVLRRFGSKEGVLEAVKEKMKREVDARRVVAAGDVVAVVDAVVNDYEASGDMVMRILAQEDRLQPMQDLAEYGRMHHREWLAQSFAPQLEGLSEERKAWRLDGLMAALDLYVWKVLRRDRGRSPPEVAQQMRLLVNGILTGQ